MKKEPLVSVAIALYKNSFLDSLFETLSNQTYQNIEYIISNDSPNDDEVIKFMKKMEDNFKIVKIYNHKPSLGARLNYDFCFDKSSGDYFMRLDDDDSLLNNNHIEALVDRIQEGYDYVLANTHIILSKDKELIETKKEAQEVYKSCVTKFDFARASIYENAMLFYAMYKRDYLENYYEYLRKRDHTRHFFEGFFCHKVASEMNGSFIENQSYIFRVSNQSFSQNASIKELQNNFFLYSKKSIKYFLIDSGFSFFNRTRLALKLFFRVARINIYYSLKLFQITLTSLLRI